MKWKRDAQLMYYLLRILTISELTDKFSLGLCNLFCPSAVDYCSLTDNNICVHNPKINANKLVLAVFFLFEVYLGGCGKVVRGSSSQWIFSTCTKLYHNQWIY